MILANIIQSAFSPLIFVFKEILIGVHQVVGGSWGWAIIGLTIVVRVVTLPVMLKQFRSMAKLQLHAPEMNRIKQRYKDDKQRQSEEMMKYYKEQGVNPLSSCLPLLIQLPVFISLFYMLRTDLKTKICGTQIAAKAVATHATRATVESHFGCSQLLPHSGAFLFIPDITAKATGLALIVLIVLYMVSMVVTSYFSSASMERNQRIMMLALPLVFTVIIYRYPSGLLLYWITTNLTQIPLQWFVRRRVAAAPPVAKSSGTVAAEGGGRGPLRGATATAIKSATPPSSGPPRQPPRKRKKRSGRRR